MAKKTNKEEIEDSATVSDQESTTEPAVTEKSELELLVEHYFRRGHPEHQAEQLAREELENTKKATFE